MGIDYPAIHVAPGRNIIDRHALSGVGAGNGKDR
jgi:hypothetical protein